MEDFLKLTNSQTGLEILIKKWDVRMIEVLLPTNQERPDGTFICNAPRTAVYYEQCSNMAWPHRIVNETPEQIRQQWDESNDTDNKKNSKSKLPDDSFYSRYGGCRD